MRVKSNSPGAVGGRSRRWGARILTFSVGLALIACGGGGGSGGPGDGTLTFEFSNVAGQTGLPLNREISLKFSQAVDISSVSFETITFRNLSTSDPVTGVFRIDPFDNTTVKFIPTFPTQNDFSDSGLKAGNTYEVRIAASSSGRTVRSLRGRNLAVGGTVRFSMINIDANTPLSAIFDDPVAGPPQVVGTTPLNGSVGQPLNLFSEQKFDIEVFFNQPLLPTADNVNSQTIFLWDLFRQRRIPSTPILVRNDIDETRLVLRPGGILPVDTEIEVRFANSLRDIIGEGNSAPSGVNSAAVFRTRTVNDTGQGFPDTFSEGFRSRTLYDSRGAVLGFAIANWSTNGVEALKAARPFPGTGELGNFTLNANETAVFNTDSQLLLTNNGLVTVNGGIFNFANFTMGSGARIDVSGSRPLYIYATGTILIGQGAEIDASGDAGRSVFTVPNLGGQLTNGGAAGPSGGNGGAGSPMDSSRSGIQSLEGLPGNGPYNNPGAGGQPGQSGGPPGSSTDPTGAGGGGGSHLTQGRNRNNRNRDNNGCLQADGEPGNKGTIPGVAGPSQFQDPDETNNFYGRGGEFALAQAGGGQGGGGGGDQLGEPSPPAPSNTDDAGGGGGGGGGMVYLGALGNIIVEDNAFIDCGGGNGGGGSNNGESKWGGGGGGGAGGVIIMHALGTISVAGLLSVGGGTTSGDVSGDQPGQINNNRYVGGWGGSGVIQFEGPSRSVSGATIFPLFSDTPGAEFNEDPEFYADAADCAALSCPAAPGECINQTAMPLSRDLSEFSNLSMARSQWIFTGETDRRGTGWPHYEFTGVNADGIVQTDGSGNILDTTYFSIATDVSGNVRNDFIAPNTQVVIEWQGADELEPRGTGLPDPDSIVPSTSTWTTDISDLDGKRFVRFRVRFNTALDGNVTLNAPRPQINRLDFGIRF
ncbi:MAG: Ig-like domain-containing protein [Planctomycetota bacterium]